VKAAEEKHISIPDMSSFKAIPGEGVVAEYDTRNIILGNRKLMTQYEVDLSPVEAGISRLEEDGKTVVENSLLLNRFRP